MKIEWLAEDLTEARITRGFWFWRRQARVEFVTETTKPGHPQLGLLQAIPPETRNIWRYFYSNREVEQDIDTLLRLEAQREIARRDWQPVVRRASQRRLM